MRRWRSFLIVVFAFLSALVFANAAQAVTPAAGASCVGDTNGATACYLNGCYVCSGGTWVPQSLQIGTTASACSSSLAGMIQWTGTGFKGCDGTNWVTIGGSNTPAAFSFTDQTGVYANATISSNAVSLSGFTGSVPATCGAGCIAIARNGVWGGTSASFVSGDTIAIQLTSSSSLNTAATATVTVGGTTSGTWTVTTMAADPCSGSPSVGTMCANGSIYAGLTPDGNVKMYVTPCDAGMVWNGSSCTGTRTTMKWSYSYEMNPGTTSTTTGTANTNTLYGLNGNSDGPFEAAVYCYNLVANGKSDWYLPALSELNTVFINQSTIGNFDLSGTEVVYYWSSTKYASLTSAAWAEIPDTRFQNYPTRSANYPIRCTRHD